MKRLLLVFVLAAACLACWRRRSWPAHRNRRRRRVSSSVSTKAPLSALRSTRTTSGPTTSGYDPYGDWYGRLPSFGSGDYLWPYAGWYAYGKGRIQNLPKVLLVSLDLHSAPESGQPLGDPIFSLSPREAKAFWLEPELQDPARWPAFNPHLGAEAYYRWWSFTTPPFAAGDYLLHFRWDFKHPTYDLCLVRSSGHGPYKFMPGDKDWAFDAWYSFTILP